MTVPIIDEQQDPYIIVWMLPGLTQGKFDIQLDTQHFPGGVPLVCQCLLQATISVLPIAFVEVAEVAVQALLEQQAQRNDSA